MVLPDLIGGQDDRVNPDVALFIVSAGKPFDLACGGSRHRLPSRIKVADIEDAHRAFGGALDQIETPCD